VTVSEDEFDDRSLPCPHCGAPIVGYEDEVSDGDYRSDEEDVASTNCPACGGTIAVVRTHDYRLTRFAPAD
jgi:predicted RNA-binding Zn-ribbon protein involved in translation (DUF1610 family)